MKLRFRFAARALAALFFISSFACPIFPARANEADCIRETLNRVYLSPRNDQPITFSFEIEVDPRQTPKLFDYYRLPSFTEAEWMALPLDQRLGLAQKQLELKLLRSELLVKMDGAPRFLSESITVEADGRVEASHNEVTSSVEEIDERLKWFWEHIGPGAVQGHVAFVPTKSFHKGADPVANFIKNDFDLAQTEAMDRGYQAWEKDHARIPARNLSHNSLGLLDDISLDSTRARLQHRTPPRRVDLTGKMTFTTAYRPDLYGEQRVGFEIRNCNYSLPCISRKLRDTAEKVEKSFSGYRGLSDNVILSHNFYNSLPSDLRKVFDRAGAFLTGKNRVFARGGAPYQERFAYPLLPWQEHSLLKGLTAQERTKFAQDLEAATLSFRKTVEELGRENLEPSDLIERLQIAAAEWAHRSGVARRLREGHDALMARNAADLMGIEGALEVIPEISPRTARQIAESDNGQKFVSVLQRLSPESKKWLIQYIDLEGIRGSDETPSGSLIQRFVLSTPPEVLDDYIRWAKLHGQEEVLAGVAKMQFNSGISRTFDNERIAQDVLSVFSGTPRSGSIGRLVDLFQKGISSKGDIGMSFESNLLSRMASEIRLTGKGRYLVQIEGKNYSAIVSGKKIRIRAVEAGKLPALLTQAEAFEQKVLSKHKVRISDLGLLAEAKKDPHAVFVISAPAIHHQGIVVGGNVYSISSDAGVRKFPLSWWVNHWGNSILIKLRANEEQQKSLLTDLDSRMGKKTEFMIEASEKTVNCTNMVSDALARAQIIEMPNQYVRSDSKGQLEYLMTNAPFLDSVEALYARKGDRFRLSRDHPFLFTLATSVAGPTLIYSPDIVMSIYHKTSMYRDSQRRFTVRESYLSQSGNVVLKFERPSDGVIDSKAPMLDDVLISVNGKPVKNLFDYLDVIISGPDRYITLKILRDGKPIELRVKRYKLRAEGY